MPENSSFNIDKRLVRLHNAATRYAVSVNAAVTKRFKDRHPSPCAGSALSRLGADAVAFHRAVLALCATGWASCTGPILRTLLDLALSTAIIVESDDEAEIRGFRYMAFFLKAMLVRPDCDESSRDHLRGQIEAGIKRLEGNDRLQAHQFIFKDRLPGYWFAPDYYRRPTDAADKLFIPEMVQWYTILSSASHGGLLGLRLLKDEPDIIHPNRRYDPNSLSLALRISVRIVIEQAAGRDHFELDGQLFQLYERILKQLLDLNNPK